MHLDLDRNLAKSNQQSKPHTKKDLINMIRFRLIDQQTMILKQQGIYTHRLSISIIINLIFPGFLCFLISIEALFGAYLHVDEDELCFKSSLGSASEDINACGII
jgi:hypothetical protein